MQSEKTGHIANIEKVCDICNSKDLVCVDKHYMKCEQCGKIYPRKHKFARMR